MPEPITLVVLGGVVLTEGIKFLYAQAGEAIKRYHENKKAAQQATAIPSEGTLPNVIEGELKPLTIHTQELEQVVSQLEPLAAELSSYGNGYKPLEPTDTDTLQKMDSLRRLLEAVYKQPLTFRGESRGTPDFDVVATLNIVTQRGKVTVMKLGKNDGRTYKADTTINEQAETGEFTMVDATQAKRL